MKSAIPMHSNQAKNGVKTPIIISTGMIDSHGGVVEIIGAFSRISTAFPRLPSSGRKQFSRISTGISTGAPNNLHGLHTLYKCVAVEMGLLPKSEANQGGEK